jgi:hypothetical protein
MLAACPEVVTHELGSLMSTILISAMRKVGLERAGCGDAEIRPMLLR